MEPTELPAVVAPVDRLEMLVLDERHGRLVAQMDLLRAQMAGVQQEAGARSNAIRTKYSMGPNDTFDLTTGRITRKP